MLGLYATVGRSIIPVESWEQVSAAYRKTIDHLGLGASQAPKCLIVDDHGTIQYHCSYNGKVWRGATWRPGDQPIYVPH